MGVVRNAKLTTLNIQNVVLVTNVAWRPGSAPVHTFVVPSDVIYPEIIKIILRRDTDREQAESRSK